MIKVRIKEGIVRHGVHVFTLITISESLLKWGSGSFLLQRTAAS